MGSVNKVILIGNLGADPELRYTESGTPVASFTMATTEKWKDKSGTEQSQTEWHNIVAWRRSAEIASEYLSKGRSVYIEGKLQTKSWEKDGIKRYKSEVVADRLVLLGGKSENNNSNTQPKPPAEPTSNYEDDLPF